MRLIGWAAAAWLAAAGLCAAQINPALFVSPMGEPFRAEDGSRPINLWLAAADADGDGRMSREEYLANAMAFFDRLDRNDDNAAVSLESTALWDREAPELFSGWDPPQESREEQIRRQRDRFERQVEVSRDGPQLATRRGAQGYSLLNDIEPVMSCDGNFDRRVIRTEYEACALRRFTQIDKNGDGTFEIAADAPE